MVLGALKGAGSQLPGAQDILNDLSLPRGASRGRLCSRMVGSLEAWPSGWLVMCSKTPDVLQGAWGASRFHLVATSEFDAFNLRSIFFCLFALAGLGIHYGIHQASCKKKNNTKIKQ